MTRVLSALVLLPVVVGTVWFLPPVATLVLACVAALLAFLEYAGILAALDVGIPRVLAGTAVVAACVSVGLSLVSTELLLMSAVIVFGSIAVAAGSTRPATVYGTAASLFPVVYIGAALGALAAVRATAGREALLLLAIAIVISDSAQYYCGRAFGRRPLAPAISPKKTVEGAIGGLVFGTGAMIAGGLWVFPGINAALLAAVSAAIATLGMVGDLFESLLKRSAGVKDSSHLIPGHGGVLDRIDSWLFAAPVYYAFVRYIHF
jgi:phosphatidate cytidylyltransferase